MGINFILPLIAGIVMTVILGTQVAPSLVENMKIAKVENRTISNQNLIKDAIVRYIKMEGKIPKDVAELKAFGLLRDYHESNLFDGGYSFTIDKKKGTLKIFTTINDNDAGKYFSNSFKFPNKPNCVELNVNGTCKNNLWETFYLLDEETFKSLPPPEVGSIEDIKDRFSNDKKVGEKFDGTTLETTLVDGAKDYIVDITKNQVTEYVYDKDKNEWKPNLTPINVGGFGKETGVEIKDVEVPQQMMDIKGDRTIEKKLFEKVVCRTPLDINNEPTKHPKEGEEVFVINENTGLGEIVWVAPNNVSLIQKKIFGLNHTNLSSVVYTPNNICTSNVNKMQSLFNNKSTFNSPLNRWDVSNVTNMSNMFLDAWVFNKALDKWDVSNVTNMAYMFYDAKVFNQVLNNWVVSKVTNMSGMFQDAEVFNQVLNHWNVFKVTNMSGMFYFAKEFNEDISSWDVSNVRDMNMMFFRAEQFNKDISIWDVSNVRDMGGMFSRANIFNQDISSWNVSNVTDMGGMFKNGNFNQDLSKWCVTLIPSLPSSFENKGINPIWGTCPN